MKRKEKINIATSSAGAYVVSSAIAWLKHGGLQLISDENTWTIRIHKTLGVIDVFRFDGKLSKLDVFGSDWLFFSVGMFAGVLAAGVMYFIEWAKREPAKESKTEKTTKGYKVKIPRKSPQKG